MPYRDLPSTDARRYNACEAARLKYLATAKADQLITAEQYAELDRTIPTSTFSVYARDLGESAATLAAQGVLTTESDTKFAALAQVTSHFIQVFNLAVARGVFSRTDRAFYGLDMNRADVPKMTNHADVLLWAGKVTAGEAARLAANPGATPMAMPAVSDVATAKAAVDGITATHSAAKDAYDKEQADVEADRPTVDKLIADLWDTIEFRLRALDGPSRRRRAREWGIVYLTRPGETPDPEPTAGDPSAGTNAPTSGGTAGTTVGGGS